MLDRKILVVDDEARMRKLVRDYLVQAGFIVVEAADGNEAVETFFEQKNIDLIVMDVMMPGIDGFEAAKQIRQYSKVPIIMLTAKSEERDELKGFSVGVDEYITKPFSPRVLVARIEAILRRVAPDEEPELVCGNIRVDKIAHQVYADGKPADLSSKEYELLCYFIENKGIALSREKILNNVWDYDYFGEARTIDTHVKNLRNKLGEQAGKMIKTVWGYGYKLDENEID